MELVKQTKYLLSKNGVIFTHAEQMKFDMICMNWFLTLFSTLFTDIQFIFFICLVIEHGIKILPILAFKIFKSLSESSEFENNEEIFQVLQMNTFQNGKRKNGNFGQRRNTIQSSISQIFNIGSIELATLFKILSEIKDDRDLKIKIDSEKIQQMPKADEPLQTPTRSKMEFKESFKMVNSEPQALLSKKRTDSQRKLTFDLDNFLKKSQNFKKLKEFKKRKQPTSPINFDSKMSRRNFQTYEMSPKWARKAVKVSRNAWESKTGNGYFVSQNINFNLNKDRQSNGEIQKFPLRQTRSYSLKPSSLRSESPLKFRMRPKNQSETGKKGNADLKNFNRKESQGIFEHSKTAISTNKQANTYSRLNASHNSRSYYKHSGMSRARSVGIINRNKKPENPLKSHEYSQNKPKNTVKYYKIQDPHRSFQNFSKVLSSIGPTILSRNKSVSNLVNRPQYKTPTVVNLARRNTAYSGSRRNLRQKSPFGKYRN